MTPTSRAGFCLATLIAATSGQAQSLLGNSSPRDVTDVAAGAAVFVASSGSGRAEVYRTDGTVGAATPIGSFVATDTIASPGHLTVASANRVFFSANAGAGFGNELWTSDMTAAGTRRVADLAQGPGSSFPQGLVALPPSLVVFSAETASNGREPYAATPAGAVRLADIRPGILGSAPREFTRVGSRVFFVADDGLVGSELWVTDGSPQGTRRVRDIWPGSAGAAPHALCEHLGELWFCADDGVHGFELWRSDGTVAGTRMVADLRPGAGSSQPGSFVSALGKLFFVAHDGRNPAMLYATDGTAAGTGPLVPVARAPRSPAELTFAAGHLWFVGQDAAGAELWVSDGSAAGTHLVADIRPGSPSSAPNQIVELSASTILFAADDGVHGRELWRAHPLGAALVRDINSGEPGGRIAGMRRAGGSVLFGAQAGDGAGHELYCSDGTAAGTLRLENLNREAQQLSMELQHTVNASGTQTFEFNVGSSPGSIVMFATRQGPGIDLNTIGIASYGLLGVDPTSILFFLGTYSTGPGASGSLRFDLPSSLGIQMVAQASTLSPMVLSGVTTVSTGDWNLSQCPSCAAIPLRATKSFYVDDTYEYDLMLELPVAPANNPWSDVWLKIVRVFSGNVEEEIEMQALRPGENRIRGQVELRRRERVELRVYCGDPNGSCYITKVLSC